MTIFGKFALGFIILAADGGAMSVDDFVLDKKSLVGRTVNVVGLAFCANDICMMNAPGESDASFIFNAEQLDRPSRKKLLNCGPIENRCMAILTGFVADDFITSMMATSIQFQGNSSLNGAF